jgi:hypothetical protein
VSGIRTHEPGFRASEGSACLRPLGYRDRQLYLLRLSFFTKLSQKQRIAGWLIIPVHYVQAVGTFISEINEHQGQTRMQNNAEGT